MKTPFKRILAALDYSATADDVFAQAIALAQQNDSHLMLTHCVSLKTFEQLHTFMDAGCGLASSTKLQRLQDEHIEQVNQAWLWLCDYAHQAQAQGTLAELSCQVGNAASQICHLAQQWSANLILVGHGRQSNLKKRLFGDITHYVVSHAPCSVMVVQQENSIQHLPQLHRSEVCASRLRRAKSQLAQSMWNLHGHRIEPA
jgi:nucleotide-binding universal stress UspA family protein